MAASCGRQDENVAFRFHDRIEGEAGARKNGFRVRGAGAEKRDAIWRFSGIGAGFFAGRRHELDGGFQIARGKLVFRVVAGDGDENLRREIRCLAETRLARRGQKPDLGLRGGRGCETQQNEERCCGRR